MNTVPRPKAASHSNLDLVVALSRHDPTSGYVRAARAALPPPAPLSDASAAQIEHASAEWLDSISAQVVAPCTLPAPEAVRVSAPRPPPLPRPATTPNPPASGDPARSAFARTSTSTDGPVTRPSLVPLGSPFVRQVSMESIAPVASSRGTDDAMWDSVPGLPRRGSGFVIAVAFACAALGAIGAFAAVHYQPSLASGSVPTEAPAAAAPREATPPTVIAPQPVVAPVAPAQAAPAPVQAAPAASQPRAVTFTEKDGVSIPASGSSAKTGAPATGAGAGAAKTSTKPTHASAKAKPAAAAPSTPSSGSSQPAAASGLPPELRSRF